MTANESSTPTPLHVLVGALTRTLARLPPGDLATLRRLTPAEPQCTAFWRLLAGELADQVPHRDDPRRSDAERRWAVILAAMADADGLLAPGRHLGSALAGAVPEARVLRLLRAHDDALADAVRVTVHHLTTRGVVFDPTDVAWLVLSDGRADEDEVRRRIYRDFYAVAQST